MSSINSSNDNNYSNDTNYSAETNYYVRRTGAYVSMIIPKTANLHYVDDPQTVFAYDLSTGEELLSSIIPSETSIAVRNNDTTISGKFIALIDNIVVLDNNGKRISTRYDSIEYSKIPLENSYTIEIENKVNNINNANNFSEVIFRTSSLSWDPYLTLKIHDSTGANSNTGKLSFTGVVKSEQKDPITGNIYLLMYEGGESPRVEQRVMMNAVPSQKLSEDGDDIQAYSLYLGKTTLNRISHYPISASTINIYRYQFIDFGNWSIEGHAQNGYVLESPFYFPSSNLRIIDGDYIGESSLKAHQVNELIFIRTYHSPNIRYLAKVETSSKENSIKQNSIENNNIQNNNVIETTVIKTTEISLFIENVSNESQKVIISYNIGTNSKIHKIQPSPPSNIQKAGKIIWTATVESSYGIDDRRFGTAPNMIPYKFSIIYE